MHFGAAGSQEERDEYADGPRPEHEDAVAGSGLRGLGGAKRAVAGFDEGIRHRVKGIGQDAQGRDRHGDLLCQRARPAVADADLGAVLTDVLMSAHATPAGAVADHGVAHDAAADPAGVDVGGDGGHPSAPLVADAHRVGRVSLVQVGHLAGEELHISAAHTDAVDVDDHLAV
jgi:hypothetical protein